MTDLDDLAQRVWRLADAVDVLDLDEVTASVVAEALPLQPRSVQRDAVAGVIAQLTGLGPLQTFANDPDVAEIMVNGDCSVWIERAGQVRRVPCDITSTQVEELARRLAANVGRRIDRSSPRVDVRLPDGARMHAILPPLAIDGPCMTIRRFRPKTIALEDLAPLDVGALLTRFVQERATIVVAGGTSSGKTTLLNSLCGLFDPDDRVITIEDAAELRLPGNHVIRLETRVATEHTAAIGIRELVRDALRMRPDRIICGEMRGAEALDLVQALNTGHRGSLTTVHANTPADVLRRIETMMLFGEAELPLAAIQQQLVSCIDLVVMMERASDGIRRIAAVAEVPHEFDRGWELRLIADRDGVLAVDSRLAS